MRRYMLRYLVVPMMVLAIALLGLRDNN